MTYAMMVWNGHDHGSGARSGETGNEEDDHKDWEAAEEEGEMKPSWQSRTLLPGGEHHVPCVATGIDLLIDDDVVVSGMFAREYGTGAGTGHLVRKEAGALPKSKFFLKVLARSKIFIFIFGARLHWFFFSAVPTILLNYRMQPASSRTCIRGGAFQT